MQCLMLWVLFHHLFRLEITFKVTLSLCMLWHYIDFLLYLADLTFNTVSKLEMLLSENQDHLNTWCLTISSSGEASVVGEASQLKDMSFPLLKCVHYFYIRRNLLVTDRVSQQDDDLQRAWYFFAPLLYSECAAGPYLENNKVAIWPFYWHFTNNCYWKSRNGELTQLASKSSFRLCFLSFIMFVFCDCLFIRLIIHFPCPQSFLTK